jgi:hypothetical protein
MSITAAQHTSGGARRHLHLGPAISAPRALSLVGARPEQSGKERRDGESSERGQVEVSSRHHQVLASN